MYCPKCGSEYREGFTECKDCEVALVNEEPKFVSVRNVYAGFGIRFAAMLIDLVLYLVLVLPVLYWFNRTPVIDSLLTYSYGGTVIWFISFLIEVVPFWLYNAFLESSKHQGSLGRMVLKIKVVDYEGKRVTFGKATVRYFSKTFISTVALGIGFLMSAFTARKQCLHDMISDTLVIKAGCEEELLMNLHGNVEKRESM